MLKKIAKSLLRPIQRQIGIRRLRRAARRPELKIVIGAGGFFPAGWTPTEVDFMNLLRPEDWQYYFQPDSIDAILAEHVWEHLTAADGLTALRFCRQYLKKGGYIRIAVPDGYNPDPAYQAQVRPGGTGAGADDHKLLYNHDSLAGQMENAGLKPKTLEYFDAQGHFQAEDWDPESGFVYRSRRFDPRNTPDQIGYTSLIMDGIKE
ncbi:MAG: methyltransferase domain-containing protein [Saprospiraceae bacterium]